MVECRLRVVEEVTMVRVVNFMAVSFGVTWLVPVVHVVEVVVSSVLGWVVFCCMDVMRMIFRSMVLWGVIID